MRPTEYEGRFSLILGGRDVDYKPLLESREKLIKFVVHPVHIPIIVLYGSTENLNIIHDFVHALKSGEHIKTGRLVGQYTLTKT